MQVIGLQLGVRGRTEGSTAWDPGYWSNGEQKIPEVSPRGMRALWMRVQAMKELRRRDPNSAWVQGAREGFLKEEMGWLS